MRAGSEAAAAPCEEVEACCVCLDSLSAGTVCVLLLVPPRGAAECYRRACSHYIHSDCAEKLRPSKCPLCRAPFDALSEPLDRCLLGALGPQRLIGGLRQLVGLPRKHAPQPAEPAAPTAMVVELLAATLPLPEERLRRALLDAGEAAPGEVSAVGLSDALCRLGVGAAGGSAAAPLALALPGGAAWGGGPSGYGLATWACRRTRWFALKASGAAGSALLASAAGLGLGVLSAGLAAVPRDRLPEMRGCREDSFLNFVKALWMLGLMIYHGSQRPHLVFNGLKWGACAGAAFGWLYGTVSVDPEGHGFRSAFLQGLTGAALLEPSRALRRPACRVPVFE